MNLSISLLYQPDDDSLDSGRSTRFRILFIVWVTFLPRKSTFQHYTAPRDAHRKGYTLFSSHRSPLLVPAGNYRVCTWDFPVPRYRMSERGVGLVRSE